jgi:hypothetical protein
VFSRREARLGYRAGKSAMIGGALSGPSQMLSQISRLSLNVTANAIVIAEKLFGLFILRGHDRPFASGSEGLESILADC